MRNQRIGLAMSGLALLFSADAFAVQPQQAQGFTYSTRLTVAGNPVVSTGVDMIFAIFDPTSSASGGTCLLYAEYANSGQLSTDSNGVVVWMLGAATGAGKRYTTATFATDPVGSSDPNNGMAQVYANSAVAITATSVVTTACKTVANNLYLPTPADGRVLKVWWTTDPSNLANWTALDPATITSVPSATVAETLAGLTPTQTQNLVSMTQDITSATTGGAGVVTFSSGVTVTGATQLSGNVSIASGSVLTLPTTASTTAGAIWYDTASGSLKYYDGHGVPAAVALGTASGGVASINGDTTAAQLLAVGTSGTAPSWSTASGTSTLNIPMADAGGTVTAGLISNAELTALLSSSTASSTYVAKAGDTMTGSLAFTGQSAESVSMARETTAATAGNGFTIQAGGAKSGGSNLAGGNLVLSSGIATGNGGSNILMQTYGGGAGGTSDATAATMLSINGSTADITLGSGATASGGSMALGTNSASSNLYAVAIAGGTSSGYQAVAMGNSNARGTDSIAMGDLVNANGNYSTAIGLASNSSGDYSLALGYGNNSSGSSAVAVGVSSTASGDYSVAMGHGADASGIGSAAFGPGSTAPSYFETVVGSNNAIGGETATSWVASDPIFQVGNGQTDLALSTALTVLKNGNVGIATRTPASILNITPVPVPSPTIGTVSIGEGAWDGSTSGYFNGNVNGTELAINAASGFTGDLANFQVAGISKFRVDSSGNVTAGSATTTTTETGTVNINTSTNGVTTIGGGGGAVNVGTSGTEAVSVGNATTTTTNVTGSSVTINNSGTGTTTIGGGTDTGAVSIGNTTGGVALTGNTTVTNGSFSNTATNTEGSDGEGDSSKTLSWATNAVGYTGTFYNADTASNSDGLAVKVSNNTANVHAFDVSYGTTQATSGTALLTVLGNGDVGIGTAAPTSPLQIGTSLTDAYGANTNTQMRINDSPTQTAAIYQSSFEVSSQPAPASNSATTYVGAFSNFEIPASSTVNYTGASDASVSLAANYGSGTVNALTGSTGVSLDFASSGTITSLWGAVGEANNQSTGTVTTARGVYALAQNIAGGSMGSAQGMLGLAVNESAGSITNAYGSYSTAINLGAGTITNGYGGYFDFGTLFGQPSTGTITNGYGVYIGTMAGTTKYSLYSSDSTAPSYFAGNVGIGTTPLQALHVVAATGSPSTAAGTTQNGIVKIGGSTGGNGMDIGVITASPYTTWMQSGYLGDYSAADYYPISLNPKGGNVGVGTLTPNYTFHLLASAPNLRIEGASTPRISFNLNTAATDQGRWQIYANTNILNFSALNDAENAEAFYMQVNRGTGAAIANVNFPSVTSHTQIYTTGNNTATSASPVAADIVMGSTSYGGTRHDSSIMFWSAGSAARIMEHNGASGDQFYFSTWDIDPLTGGGAYIGATAGATSYFPGNTNANGTVSASGVALTSDARYKTDIKTVENGLDRILKLRGVNYYWKDKVRRGNRLQLGVIAQEVEKVFPEAVQTDEKGMKSVFYTDLIAPLIESVKTLYAKLVSHESRIAALEQSANRAPASSDMRLEKLEKENAALKAYLCGKEPGAPICK